MTVIEIASLLVGTLGLLLAIVAIVLVYKVRVFDVEKIVSSMNYRVSDITRDTASLRDALRDVTQIGDSLRAHAARADSGQHIPVAQWEFAQQTYKNRVDKALICKHIVQHCIQPNTRILLDSGSTIDLVLAELLHSEHDAITVYSNNIFAAMHLIGSKKTSFHVLGGRFNEPYAACYGDNANAQLETLSLDVFILATSAFRLDKGVMAHSRNP